MVPANATQDEAYKYINRFEHFKQNTIPNLRIKTVVKVQAMARGWIARHRLFKGKAQTHLAAV